jgi:hypothetical protein
VLEPSYRVELRWVDAAGQEVAAHVSAEPDPWRALAGDVVRMRYRAPGRAEDQQRTLAIVVHTADAGQVIGSLEVPFD